MEYNPTCCTMYPICCIHVPCKAVDCPTVNGLDPPEDQIALVLYCSLFMDTLFTSRVRFYTYNPSVITHANNTSFPKIQKKVQDKLSSKRHDQNKRKSSKSQSHIDAQEIQ